jgi:hypothetical protein
MKKLEEEGQVRGGEWVKLEHKREIIGGDQKI